MYRETSKEQLGHEIENLVKTAEKFSSDESVYTELYRQMLLNVSCNN